LLFLQHGYRSALTPSDRACGFAQLPASSLSPSAISFQLFAAERRGGQLLRLPQSVAVRSPG
jgi:hypothetical protein